MVNVYERELQLPEMGRTRRCSFLRYVTKVKRDEHNRHTRLTCSSVKVRRQGRELVGPFRVEDGVYKSRAKAPDRF